MPFRLDRRTRRDADLRHVSPQAFFAEDFPRLASINGHLVTAPIEALGAPPLAVEVDGSAWTIQHAGDTVEAHEGLHDGALVVTLSSDQFSDWVQNQMTFNGFLTGRALQFRQGSLMDVSVWDSLWITLLEGWRTTDDALSFVDRHGAPLDLRASFTPHDDPADMAHFIREAGYLHLRGWLDPADMAAISGDMDRALPLYAEGDGKSWWAGLKDGSRRCVRLQEFVEHSPTTARILSGETWERVRRIVADPDELACVPVEGRIIEALIKPLDVVSGPSDVSWHRDCHLGRHAYSCSGVTIGIALTPTAEDNGMLRAVAGSHRVAMPVEVAKTNPYLPVIGLAAEQGDLTVHLSCMLHESTPPRIQERRVMYAGIPLAPLPGVSLPSETGESRLRERVTDILRDVKETSQAEP